MRMRANSWRMMGGAKGEDAGEGAGSATARAEGERRRRVERAREVKTVPRMDRSERRGEESGGVGRGLGSGEEEKNRRGLKGPAPEAEPNAGRVQTRVWKFIVFGDETPPGVSGRCYMNWFGKGYGEVGV
jgi:hypothetical protein